MPITTSQAHSALPTEADFLANSITKLDISSLPEDEQSCIICQREYSTKFPFFTPPYTRENLPLLDALPFAQIARYGRDEPVQLPCGHIFGSICLLKWLRRNMPSQDLFGAYASCLNESYASPIRTLLTHEWTPNGRVIIRSSRIRTILGFALPSLMIEVAVQTQRPRAPRQIRSLRELGLWSVGQGFSFNLPSASFGLFTREALEPFFRSNPDIEPDQPFVQILHHPLMQKAYEAIFEFFLMIANDSVAGDYPVPNYEHPCYIDTQHCRVFKWPGIFQAKIEELYAQLDFAFQDGFEQEFHSGIGAQVRRAVQLSIRALLEVLRPCTEIACEERFVEFSWEFDVVLS
ncbi:hypothetical protein K458DRAFT_388405 [Lentithecium fluviatile CBS 122367]|uniref:RING-type domain-containing protein n=1 Tax=Lentithecium fluviatile CBS 122367 TaxID=1168545 RepID=A0A6G1J2F8_9PLEO|nr:hypothetical protein K458DRAFT_388405 [Lentithecium fluviatile CBS 122367]